MAARAATCIRRGGHRVFLYCLLGLIVIDVVIAAGRNTWRAYDPDEYRERVANCRRRPHDLVLVGGSPASEGLDPAPLQGLRWRGQALRHPYNLGLPGGTTSEVWHAVEHALTDPPRLLVYGITASDLNDNRDEPEGPRMLMDWRDLAAWVRCRPDRADWCCRQMLRERLERLCPLTYYHTGFRLWTADRMDRFCPDFLAAAAAEARQGRSRSAALHRPDGYAPDPAAQIRRLDVLKSRGTYGPPFHFLERFRLGGHTVHLHCLLDWAKQHGVAVVLLDMPVSADLEQRLHPQEFARYRAALAEVERQRGVPVLRASRTAVGLDDTHFADLIHLNAGGAARLGAWLRRRLEEM